MKYLFILLLFVASSAAKAQKYVLLDEAFAQPAVYKEHLTEMEKYKKFFPVMTKDLPRFLNVLQEINSRLSHDKVKGPAKNYKVGCVEFTGKVFPLVSGERIDYVLTSNCDGVNVTMHLCDAQLSNATNAFFIKTWIKYITSTIKEHHQ